MVLPTWLVVVFILIVIGILYEIGVFEILFGLFSAIYEFVKPRRTFFKIVVALISVLYGVFAIFVMGGPILMWMPFFLNPIGFVIEMIIIVGGYIVLAVILRIVIAPFDSPARRKHTQVETTTRAHKPVIQCPNCQKFYDKTLHQCPHCSGSRRVTDEYVV